MNLRRKFRLTWLLALAVMAAAPLTAPVAAEIVIKDAATAGGGEFPLVSGKVPADIFYESGDAKVVDIVSHLLATDIQSVTGIAPYVSNMVVDRRTTLPSRNAVFIGTLGHSPVIDALIKANQVDVTAIAGQWESYKIVRLEKPRPDLDSAILVIGADRRGTAYGALAISEAIGVSPWSWWADVPSVHHDNLNISLPAVGSGAAGTLVQGPPSVKYRGIFINDEDWGMQPWAAKTVEPKSAGGVGDIGPKTYAHIFELLLRLKANYCWPAMHPSTQAFNIYPQNKFVADDYAIVMGSSHCEQLLRNGVTEWKDAQGRIGEAGAASYNWVTNKAGIIEYWSERLKENGKFENTYTLGLRGVHDSDMAGGGTVLEKAARLNEIYGVQRDLLKEFVNPDITKVPQMIVPYKEALIYYQNGAIPPDDVSIVWVDDNHGYIRQLSTPAEQKRSGGAGVYYHLSYWGRPHDYLWLCTTPPALVWEELSKAYDYDARTVWVMNVGDLKPAEIDITLAMEIAYDAKKYNVDTIGNYLKDFATRTFGPAHAGEIAAILDEYYHLDYQRKPEHMGFNTSQNPGGPIQPTEFSDAEITSRLADFAALREKTDKLYDAIPKEQRDAFFELVAYPVRGATLQNEKMLEMDVNRRAAARGDAALAADSAQKSRAAYDQIQTETAYYNNTLAGGKWKYMMSASPRNVDVFKAPVFAQVKAGATPPPAELKWTPPGTMGARIPSPPGTFYEQEGVVSIAAEHFTRKVDRGDAAWHVIPGLGRLGDSVAVFPTTTPSIDPRQVVAKAPALEYDFVTATAAAETPTITVEAIPTHRINPERGLRYAIAIDNEAPQIVDLETAEFSAVWSINVLRGSAFGVTKHAAIGPQPHTLHIYMVDPGIVLDHIVIDLGGEKKSYLPPPETRLPK